MPNKTTMTKLGESEREEILRRLKFIQENRHQYPGLVTEVAEACGVSKPLVSVTFKGTSINPGVVREAHRRLSIKIGLPDPSIADALGIFQTRGAQSAGLSSFLKQFNTLQSAGQKLKAMLKALYQLEQEIKTYGSSYGDLYASVMREYEIRLPNLPDTVDTLISESLREIPLPSELIPIQERSSDGKMPGESDVEYSIRMLQESGAITAKGFLEELPVENDPSAPGEHVDPETGQTYVLGRD